MLARRSTSIRSVLLNAGLALSLAFVLGSSANADFNFNPTGGASTPTYSVNGLGFGPGNALAVGSIPLTVGKTFQVYFQTHLTSLTGPNAPPAVPGLNTTFQVTEVAVLTEKVVSVVTNSSGTTAMFALAGGPNQVNIYENNAVTYNDAKGTGFTDGTIIMSLTGTSFKASQFTDATQGGGAPTVMFNQTGAGNAPGATADQGNGSSGVNLAVNSYDSKFFQPPTGAPMLISSLNNFNVSSFFDAISPSLLFTDPTTNTAFAPNIGANNGTSGPDFQLQVSGFTQSFSAVPEPASVAMTVLGLVSVGVGSVVARRRRVVA